MTTKRIGILDCETLALETDAVVYEICLLTVEVNDYYETVGRTFIKEYRPEILSQLAKGRRISRETIEFQFRTFGDKFPQIVYGADDSRVSIRPVLTELQTLKRETCDLKELWINKTSFDYSCLHSLAEDFGFFGGLWPHRIELDVRTLRDALRLPDKDGSMKLSPAHRAVDDCMWNLGVLEQFGRFKRLDVKAKRKVVKRP